MGLEIGPRRNGLAANLKGYAERTPRVGIARRLPKGRQRVVAFPAEKLEGLGPREA